MDEDELPLTHVSVPPEAGADPSPAAVLLHGRGADKQDLLPIGRRLPDTLYVLSVRAPGRLRAGYTWYDIDASEGLHGSQPDPEGLRRSLDLIHEFVDGAAAAYDLDPDRIGLLGFSQGAIASLSALLERPDGER